MPQSEYQHSPAVVWTIVASQFTPPFMFSGVAVALPTLGADLHAGAVSLGLMETLFLGGGLAFLLPIGRLADVTDKRTLYKYGLFAFGISSLILSTLSWMPLMLLLRFCQGLTSAIFATTGPAILADIVPPARRGRVFGVSLGMVYAGLSLGPIVAGEIIPVFGWRGVFLCGAILLLCGFALTHRLLPSAWRKPERSSVHIPSASWMATAVLLFVASSATMRTLWLGTVFFCLGSAAVVRFVRLQSQLATPFLDLQALRVHHVLRDALTTQLLLYLNAFASIFLLSLFTQVTLGCTPRQSGQVLATGTVLMAAIAPLAGRLADKIRPTTLSSSGCALVFVSACMATRFNETTDITYVITMLAVQGLGYALFSSPNMTTIMGSVPPESLSMASALGAKARSIGMVTGMLITGLLFSLNYGQETVTAHPERLVDTVLPVYWVLVGTSALAFGFSCWTIHQNRAMQR